MRTRLILPVALLAIGALFGWYASDQSAVRAEDPKPADPHGWIGTETVKTRLGNL